MYPVKRIFLVAIIVILGLILWWQFAPRDTVSVDNELEKADLIRLDTPRPNQIISSPLAIKGVARGYWFFEASFPVVLVNWDGLIIAQGIATAQDEWMTEYFVPFEATLTFTVEKDVYSNRGALILRKDNPSGLPEHDDALEIPVMFEKVESDDSGILPFNSGVSGIVSLGPTCPVMQYPPDPDCNDKPFETTVQVFAKNSASTAPFAVTRTDKEGRYSFALPPGGYTLQAVSGKPFPSCGAQSITIEPEVAIEVNLSCDTGIR